MIIIQKKRIVLLTVIALAILTASLIWSVGRSVVVHTEYDYRVFVAGIGTIEGKWSGETGIAVTGLETRPAPQKGWEIKIIDLLVANSSSENIKFNPDISLINNKGESFGVKAREQPEVIVRAGTLSQGTVIISVPKGLKDKNWRIQLKGGNLKEEVLLPLSVMKAGSKAR